MGGEISSSLLELRNLNYLDLSHNYFGGLKIPKFIASHGQLKHLRLASVGFIGPLPHQLGNLSNLITLDLSFNSVTIDSLDWLSGLSSLRYLNLSGLNLSAVDSWQQSISKLPSLKELQLFSCSLHNVNPRSLPYINSSTSLEVLELSNNHLSPSIFSWVVNISRNLVHIGLHENKLTGPIPDVFTSTVSLQSLVLSFNQLEGGIPKSFQNLCSLEVIQLGRNKLSDRLLDSLKNLSCAEDTLKYLDLSSNRFWGPFPDVASFSFLIELFFDDNILTGTLPKNLGQLSKLERLGLVYNQLSGPLPDFTGLSSLRWLRLHNNQLNGSIPESIGQLYRLEDMDISSNLFDGNILESHFSNLSRLQYLHISQNPLSFNVSSDWFPPFQLSSLAMESCKVGPAFPKWLQTQRKLNSLDMSKAGISDSIPSWFLDLPSTLVYLNISFNQIHGKLPHLSSKSNSGISFDFSSNRLYGPLPSFPPGTFSLFLSKNMFSGSISSLCASPPSQLYQLELSDNRFSGQIPTCWGQFQGLRILNLARNNFTGRIPSSLGYLPAIGIIRLQKNNLTGEMPSFQNSKSLALLDLGENRISGKLPKWLPEYLLVLRLRSNKFHGRIPTSWCSLQALQVLDLSLNNISGVLPQCFSNMTAMKSEFLTYASVYSADVVWKGIQMEFGRNLQLMRSIDISSNHLRGTIPESITSLLKLMSLNLSRNNLTGSIPSDFGDLNKLEALDLSRNHISGTIPTSFSSLNFLGKLDLSHNNLTGQIPLTTQLQSFDASVYMENLQLCGPPLTKYCPGDRKDEDPDNTENDKNQGNEDEELVTLGFYVSIGIGFFVGFWGVCGSLLLKSSWRYAYFRFWDNMNDWIYMTTRVFKARLQRALGS